MKTYPCVRSLNKQVLNQGVNNKEGFLYGGRGGLEIGKAYLKK